MAREGDGGFFAKLPPSIRGVFPWIGKSKKGRGEKTVERDVGKSLERGTITPALYLRTPSYPKKKTGKKREVKEKK